MKAVAIKKTQPREKEPAGFQQMGTFRCDTCGEDFVIWHEPSFANKWGAEQQARWLEKVLAEEHEREKKHDDRVQLPD